jgi:gamma-glutamyltranspeptidase / glutathione hydrolase
MSRRGMVASSQPLAVECAAHVLRSGGNAIDAAVTASFVLNVVEPMSTGIGGDCFAIIYSAREKKLIGLNGSGRSPAGLSRNALIERGIDQMPLDGPLSVTVPGALEAFARCLKEYGTISLSGALAPAMFYAEHGFPVTEVISRQWHRATNKLKSNAESNRVYLKNGTAPIVGELFCNSDLAKALKYIAEQGIESFYRGEIAERIVSGVQELGGVIRLSDLAEHSSDWVKPISTNYRGFDVVELPPNNHGLATLIALSVLEDYPLSERDHHSTSYLHHLIDAMTLGLAAAKAHVGDPSEATNVDELLSKDYARKLRSQIDLQKAGIGNTTHGDTVFVAAVDEQRNVVSMISSVYKLFGSGITVPGTGIVLQNRAAGFTLEPNHPNTLAPRKRPYHTIMPGMIMRDDRPWASFGVVGGMMQPQGHLQLVSNLVDFEMNPQAALDAPRFRVLEDGSVALEDGIDENVSLELESLGHRVKPNLSEEEFGGGQVIVIENDNLYGGSDNRKDGCAIGY